MESTNEYLPVEYPSFLPHILSPWVLTFGRAHRKEDDSVAGMSRGVVGRTVEGTIVCVKVFALLLRGIRNVQISNSTLPVSTVCLKKN